MKSKFEYQGEAFATKAKVGTRKPLRTATELAEELGVTLNTLSALMRHHNGPPPAHKTQSRNSKATWYDPQQVRAWFKALPK